MVNGDALETEIRRNETGALHTGVVYVYIVVELDVLLYHSHEESGETGVEMHRVVKNHVFSDGDLDSLDALVSRPLRIVDVEAWLVIFLNVASRSRGTTSRVALH